MSIAASAPPPCRCASRLPTPTAVELTWIPLVGQAYCTQSSSDCGLITGLADPEPARVTSIVDHCSLSTCCQVIIPSSNMDGRPSSYGRCKIGVPTSNSNPSPHASRCDCVLRWGGMPQSPEPFYPKSISMPRLRHVTVQGSLELERRSSPTALRDTQNALDHVLIGLSGGERPSVVMGYTVHFAGDKWLT